MDLLTKALFVLILSISSSAYQSNSRLKIKPRMIINENNSFYKCGVAGLYHRIAAEECVYKKLNYTKEERISGTTNDKSCCFFKDNFCVDTEIIGGGFGCTVSDNQGLIRWAEEQYKSYKDKCMNAGIVPNSTLCEPLMHYEEGCDEYEFPQCFHTKKPVVITPTPPQSDDTTKADESNIEADGTTIGSDGSNTGSDENGDIPGDTRTSTPRSGAQYLCLSVEIVIVFVATLLNF